MTRPAPLFDDIASLPPGGEAFFLPTEDGKTLRVARWGGDGGTVLLCPGRGEFLEKYGEVIAALLEAGFGVLAFEWRGQGHSTRLDGMVYGHVEDFAEYQVDMEALLPVLDDMPKPLHLFAHSMGALIATRSLAEGFWGRTVERVVFSSPMYRFGFSGWKAALGPLIIRAVAALGFGKTGSPQAPRTSFFETLAFEQNKLTNDPDRYASWRAAVQTHQELRVGGPSMAWSAAAFREMPKVLRLSPFRQPALIIRGEDERVVSEEALDEFTARLAKAETHFVRRTKHEPLMDLPEVSGPAIARVVAFLTR